MVNKESFHFDLYSGYSVEIFISFLFSKRFNIKLCFFFNFNSIIKESKLAPSNLNLIDI